MPAREYKQFKGLIPNIDRKRVDSPFVCEGRNFLVDVDGPVSIFGRTWRAYRAFSNPRNVQALYDTNKDALIYTIHDSFQMFDQDTFTMYPVYTHSTRTLFSPWSQAAVGLYVYYVNAEIGTLLRRHRNTGTWEIISGANIPTGLIACCACRGRLVVVNATIMAWSTVDDASNSGFAPSSVTGAGFQALSILAASPQPMRVLPCAIGVLVYCAEGILRASLTQITAAPFRFDVLADEYDIINPWCVVEIKEGKQKEHLLVTRRGFFVTTGEAVPVPWQPVFSEYLARRVFPTMTLSYDLMNLRLEYDHDEAWVILSIAEDSREFFYSVAYVLYLTVDEWGSYNRSHMAFMKATADSGAFASARLGVVDSEGSLFEFTATDSDRLFPDDTENEQRLYLPFPYDGAPRIVTGSAGIYPSHMRMTDEPLLNTNGPGVYYRNYIYAEELSPETMEEGVDSVTEGTPTIFHDEMTAQDGHIRITVQPIPYTDYPLNARVLVGPIRWTNEEGVKVDGLVQMHEYIVGMLDSGIDDTSEDYVEGYTATVEEDWLTASGDEDWGTAAGSSTNYSLTVTGTIDGYRPWTVNEIAQELEPTLVQQIGRTKHFAGQCSGMYNYLDITADLVGEMFHLKHLKIGMIYAGELF